MNLSEYKRLMLEKQKAEKKHKYRAKAVQSDGYSFASQLESAVYQLLKLRQIAGEIEILQVQDHVHLTDARIAYVPDFRCRYVKNGEEFWVEAKGMEGPRWPTIKKLWKHYGPGALEIWKGRHQNPKLHETIIPVSRKDAA